MRFELEIQTDDEDATSDPIGLICWVLLGVSSRVVKGVQNGVTFDRNGNRVGSWAITKGEDEDK